MRALLPLFLYFLQGPRSTTQHSLQDSPLYNPAFLTGLPTLQPGIPCRASRPAPGSLCRTPRPAPGSLCRASRPATRRPLLKKGSIRKLFLRTGNILFLWKGEESGIPELLIFGCRSMDTGRRPLCGCFVLSCMVGGIFRKPLGFRRCLPPARPEKALPFQAGQSPCTKHPQIVRLCLHALKKVFEGSKGRFFKNAPLAGSGTASHEERKSQSARHAISGGTKSLHETPTDCPASPLRT